MANEVFDKYLADINKTYLRVNVTEHMHRLD